MVWDAFSVCVEMQFGELGQGASLPWVTPPGLAGEANRFMMTIPNHKSGMMDNASQGFFI